MYSNSHLFKNAQIYTFCILGYKKYESASHMFVTSHVDNFDAFMRFFFMVLYNAFARLKII